MTGPAWVGFLAAAALALGLTGVQYWRRESAARARWVLGGLRASALLLLLLILFDPSLRAGAGAGERSAVLLDASLSMRGPSGEGTRWDAAAGLASTEQGGLILFGDGARPLPRDSLATVGPAALRSDLVEAVRVAAEAGARRVRVVTDGEVEDAAAAAAAAREAGVALAWSVVPAEPVPNAALAEFDAPRWAAPGDTVDVSVAVAVSAGTPPDSLRVEVRSAGELLGAAPLPVPPVGGLARADVAIVVPRVPGAETRLDARVVPGGAHREDDERSAYVRVAEEGGGVVVVALEPDWEIRFLLPALEAATALPAVGYLAAGPAGWVRAGERAGRVTPATVAGAARAADLLVVLGAGPDAPEWVRALLASGPPLVLFPAAGGAPAELPVAAAASAGAEWYLTDRPPASPLAAALGALAVDSLPPLEEIRPVGPDAPGHRVVLTARRARRGAEAPVLVVGERAGARWAAPLATGFWRWSLRGGRARSSYRQAWSAVAGWLLAGEPTPADEPVTPVRRVVARGAAHEWAVRAGGDSLRVVFTPEGGGPPRARTAAIAGGAAVTEALPPGHYTYEARADGPAGPVARGALTVESFTREFVRPAQALEDVPATGAAGVGAADARPLHGSPLAYLLLIALLCAEWILRRREGLR